MTNNEIQMLLDRSRQVLRVVCPGSHAHTGRAGCLAGNEKDIAIVQLCETLLNDRSELQQLAKRAG